MEIVGHNVFMIMMVIFSRDLSPFTDKGFSKKLNIVIAKFIYSNDAKDTTNKQTNEQKTSSFWAGSDLSYIHVNSEQFQ